MTQNPDTTAQGGAVAYVLKGYPRMSELFIASEIYRLEQLGVRLRLHVIKPADEAQQHGIVARIKTRPEYLPATSSLTKTSRLMTPCSRSTRSCIAESVRATMLPPSPVAAAGARRAISATGRGILSCAAARQSGRR